MTTQKTQLNLENDAYFPFFTRLMGAVRSNNKTAYDEYLPYVQELDEAPGAFAVCLVNSTNETDPLLISSLAHNAFKDINIDHPLLNLVHFYASQAAVKMVERGDIANTTNYLPKLEQFKNDMNFQFNKFGKDNFFEMEEGLYLDIAVEKQNPDMLKCILQRQVKNKQFDLLGMASLALDCVRHNSDWALQEMKTLGPQLGVTEDQWLDALIMCREEGKLDWANDIVQHFSTNPKFKEFLNARNEDKASIYGEHYLSACQMISDFRTRKELDTLANQSMANRRNRTQSKI